MEDRIVGPLTLYQFLYVLAGGMLFYLPFKAQSITGIIFLGVPGLLLGVAFAFLKVQDQPFAKFLSSLLGYGVRPKIRVWHKGGQYLHLSVNPAQKTASSAAVTPKKYTPEQMAHLAQNLDKPQSHG